MKGNDLSVFWSVVLVFGIIWFSRDMGWLPFSFDFPWIPFVLILFAVNALIKRIR